MPSSDGRGLHVRRGLCVGVGVVLALAGTTSVGVAQRGPVGCVATFARLLGETGADSATVAARLAQDDRPAPPDRICGRLAVWVNDSLEERWERDMRSARNVLSPRDLQSRTSGDAGGAAGVSQGEAVPTIQPTALASGSLAALGSGGGSDALIAISLNPLGLFSSGTANGNQATRSRTADLTLFAPVGSTDDSSTDRPRYLGVRLRVNALSWRQGSVLDSAEQLFRDRVTRSAAWADSLATLLRTAPLVEACVREVLAGADRREDRVREFCGGAFDAGAAGSVAREFRAYTAAIRDSLDATFLGLDIRYDRGDPTFGAIAGLDGTFLFAGIVGGRSLRSGGPTLPSYGLRGRLGVQHATLGPGAVVTERASAVALDAAVAFDASYPATFRPLRLAAGLEYRRGDAITDAVDAALERDGLRWRIAIDVPLTAANGVTVAYATPLGGDGRPSLTVGFNWQMLLQELAPGAANW